MIVRIASCFLLLFTAGVGAEFRYYEEPDPRRYLVDIGPLPVCDYVIDTPAKWSNINSTNFRVFCIAPGDYSSLGRIAITADGTATAKRWLRYYDPTGQISDATHPYHMPDAKRARVSALFFNGANHWIVDRIFIKPVSAFKEHALLSTDSSNNIYNRLFTTEMAQGITMHAASTSNTIQRTVASKMRHGSDGVGFLLLGAGLPPSRQPKFNRIVSNECFDVNDCTQLMGRGPTDSNYIGEENYEGTVVYDNDFYLTPASYTNCSGTYTTTGDCACKEDAIDIKSGSANAANPVIVAHNRMWGHRPVDTRDPTCVGPSGTGTSSNTIVVHLLVRNLNIEGNISWHAGFTFGKAGIENTNVKSNLFGTLHHASSISGNWQPGIGFWAHAPVTNVTIAGNVFSNINAATSHKSFQFQSAVETSKTVTFSNNVLINSKAPVTTAFAGTVSGNRYYAAAKPSWDTNPAENSTSVAGSGWENKFCTKIKRITAPETKCFANALGTTGGSAPIGIPGDLKVAQ